MRIRSLGVLAILVLLVAALSLPTVAAVQSETNRDLIVSSRSDPTWKVDTRPWTLERMRNAKPYPMPVFKGTKGKCQPATVGEPGLIPSVPEDTEWSLEEVMDSIQRFPTVPEATEPLGYAYPPPYTRYQTHPRVFLQFPHRAVGVLFFTQNGIDYRCSASSIGNYAIWTAGHCVSDGSGSWSYNLLFIPAYKDGLPPVSWAQFTESYLWSFTDWHSDGDLCRDSGGAVLYPNSGKKVSAVGSLGFAWNWDRDQHWHQIGYPAEPPFDGNRQIICASSHSSDADVCVYTDNPITIGTGCDMTGGSSGGPWIVNFTYEPGAGNYLNGNVSYGFVGYPEEMFSPYFDDSSYNLWYALVTSVP